jgi:tetratricopeptide (TPR) repeat protein
MDRRPLLITGERAPTCGPPVQAQLAETALALLLGDEEGREFARRWYLAMALRSIGDVCFIEGRQWAATGLKKFPKDKELLLARGVVDEAAVALTSPTPPNTATLNPFDRERVRELEMEARAVLVEACRFFEQALAVDPGLEEARLHLGRVRFRLDQQKPALAALQAVVAKGRDPGRLYLAHLFLGRVHEAARRPAEAEREYRAALALDPGAQSAAMALAHLRLMGGDADGSRAILNAALGHAGSRISADPFWAYQLGTARGAEPLLEALRDEATR